MLTLCAVRLLAASVVVAGLGDSPPARQWEPVREVVGLRDASAVALDPQSGRVAVGDRSGVRLFLPGVPAQRVLRRGPVHDLAFGANGVLYAATARGLFRIPRPGEVVGIGLGPSGPERVERVVAAGGWVVAGGDGGLFVSGDGRAFGRLAGGLGRAPALAIALRGREGVPPELWWTERGALVRGGLAAGEPPRIDGVERFALPTGALAREPLEILLDTGEERAVVFADRRIARLRGGRLETLSPGWPAGARALRAQANGQEIFVATSRGLVVATRWSGPWQRAGSPAGDDEVTAVAAHTSGGAVWTVGARGLLRGRARVAATGAASVTRDVFAARLRTEPTIQEVHAAVVRHQDLTGRRMRDLSRGVRRRGWLPTLTVGGGYGDLRRARIDRDQVVFSSGIRHELLDEQSDRDRDWEASLALSWDFGDVLYHPESIDVSRESREWVELRDEVLDEVNQLYFERRRVLLELAAAPPDSAEAARQRVRADELAAGLDAWTGGWFGFRTPALSNSIRSPRAPEEKSSP